ncbi:TPA: tape measure protein [Streptococcus pyogenes]|uniref:tape measure protein n=1 Tax=Streptococcus pyogenes TaxID=1314 RepID=UPI000640B81D|nr:tape measure protein [Streptococcus pyogenes]HER4515962.1 tape measure protein [Streptococcus pyogenes NGAS743]HER4524748.1 tape measure protein [Streptococcus pyogenes NGAS747]HER4528152.1 tape measure protein [Streptococcus pyogenes NGAS739]HER4539690.1 tape measure protein [Streptococcus pyogenes NGAS668]HER4543112.1 tape measure protein [Streptococcus pyogenes NGAS669]HER4551762.1 tape measure protein [Streptococcus pyogenes NGAS662]HER4555457.1 tape measure protein [Streptococcus pyo
MGESYSVEAVLTAVDKTFGKTLQSAIRSIEGLEKRSTGFSSVSQKASSMFKSMLGANLAGQAISAMTRTVSSGLGSMLGEMNSSAKAWKTFDANLADIGFGKKQILAAKTAMQDYATKTIYSASDMASTYAQLAAVGVKDTGKLVKAFGGLAASAENPKQAMKSISQQMTQAVGRPTVAWQDFRIMLEQAPAGMAKVAKSMGKNLDELVADIQAGRVKTSDFLEAVKKAGNDKSFQKMATEFKTVDQAIDGMREGLSNKLQPAFEKVNQFGIRAIEAIGKQLDKVDFSKFASNLGKFLEGINIDKIVSNISSAISSVTSKVKEFWDGFKQTGAISAFSGALQSVWGALKNVASAMSGGNWKTFGATVGGIVKHVSNFAKAVSDVLGKMDPGRLRSWIATFAAVAGGFKLFEKLTGQSVIGSFLDKIGSKFGLFGNKAKEGTDKASNGARRSGGIISQIFSGLGNIVKSAGTAISTAAKGIGAGIKTALSGIPPIISSLGTAISTVAQGIGTGLAIAFKGLGSAIAMVPPTTWLALGAAILMVGAAFALAGTQADGISQILRTVGDVVVQILQQVADSLATLIPIIASAIGSILPIIAGAISQIVTAVTAGIATVIGAFTGLLGGVSGVINSISAVIQSLTGVITAVFNGIATVISSVGSTIKDVLTGLGTAFEGFGNGVKSALEGVGAVIESFGSAVRSVLDGVANILDSMGTAALNAGRGVKEMAKGIKMLVDLSLGDLVATLAAVASGLGKMASSAGGMAILGSAMSKVANGMTRLATAIGALVASIAGLSAVLSVVSAGFSQIGASATAAVGQIQAFASSTTVVSSAFASMQSMIQSAMAAIVSSIITSFNQAASQMQSILSRMLSQARTFGSQLEQQMRQSGQRSGQNLAQGLSSQRSAVINAISSMVNAAVSRANAGAGPMRQAGAYIGQGLAQGMYSALGAVTAAANALVAQAERAARAKAMIHSPSRLFAKRVGQYIPQGVAMGIDKNADVVDDSVGGLFDSVNSFDFNIADRLASIGAKFQGVVKSESSQSLSQQQEFVHTAQPAYINFSLGGNEYEAFVSDITSRQAKIEKIRLKRSSW